MHLLREERHSFVKDLTLGHRPFALDGTEAHKERGNLTGHPDAAAHAGEPAKRAVTVLTGREGGEHRHAALLLLHFVKERNEALSAGLLLLCLHHPRGLAQQDVGQLLVPRERTLQGPRILILRPTLDDGSQIIFVGKMVSDAAAIISRGDGENIVACRCRQGGQSLQSKVERLGHMLDGQGLVPCTLLLAPEEIGEVHRERRVAFEQVSPGLADVLHVGKHRQVAHFAVAAALANGFPPHGKHGMVGRCLEGHLVNSLLARLEVEADLHLLQQFVTFRIVHLQDSLAPLPRLGSVADAGRQAHFVAVAQEARQRQFCHQLLLRHNRFLPLGSHHVLGMCKAVQVPRGEALGKGELDGRLPLAVSP